MSDIKKTERAFPKRSKLPPLSGNLFDKIYWIVAANVTVVSLVSEHLLLHDVRSSWIIAALLVYIYLLVRFTFRDGRYFPQIVTAQAILLSVVAYSTRGVLPEPEIIFEFILPIIYLISMVLIGIYLLIYYKNPRRFLLNLVSVSLLGFLPVFVLIFMDTQARILAIITAAIGFCILVSSFIFYARTLISELKRKFHF